MHDHVYARWVQIEEVQSLELMIFLKKLVYLPGTGLQMFLFKRKTIFTSQPEVAATNQVFVIEEFLLMTKILH